MEIVPLSRRRSSRHTARALRAALAAGLALALVLMLGAAVSARSSGPNSTGGAQVIVQFDDHDVAARAITLTGPVSGLSALELTGLDVVTITTSYGPAVCSIQGKGCPATDCFCDSQRFWNYNYWDGQSWQSYPVGPGGSVVNLGGIEGWRWGSFGAPMMAPEPVAAAQRALDWLRPRQSLADGGYGNDSGTAEALIAVGADTYSAAGWRRQSGSPSLLHYVMAHAARYAGYGPAEAGKLAVGMAATNACAPRGMADPAAYYDSQTGAYFLGAGPHSWAMLGTAALGQVMPSGATNYLKGLVQSNGAWEWAPGWGTDTNSTALALQALVAAGEPPSSGLITNALAYMKAAQNTDGGFPYEYEDSAPRKGSDTDSTAYVLQALWATGQNPLDAAWQSGGHTAVGYLMGAQLADGSFEWQKGMGSNQLATEHALVALLGRSYPLRAAAVPACQGGYLPSIRH